MKKIVALSICLVLSAACIAGCANNDAALTWKSYTAQGEEITEVCIDIRDRQIEVMLSPDNQVHIDYFENSKEYYNVSVSDNHTLTMTAESDKEWTDYIGRKSAAGSRKISLQVPDTLLTALKLSTTNENILLPALTVIGDISLSCDAKKGESNLPSIKENGAKKLTVSSNNGDINIEFINK